MARPVEAQAFIARDADAIFALLVAFDHAHAWRPSVAREELLDPPLRAGARVEETRIVLGKPRTIVQEVSAYEPPRRLALRAVGGLERVFDLAPEDGGTRVRYAARLEGPLRGLRLAGVRARLQEELLLLRDHLERRASW